MLGSGVGLSIFSPIIIATEKSVFGDARGKNRCLCGSGGEFRVYSTPKQNRSVFGRVTGGFLRGEDVFISGLAHYYIPSSQI